MYRTRFADKITDFATDLAAAGVWISDPVCVGSQHWLAGHRHKLVHQLEGQPRILVYLTLFTIIIVAFSNSYNINLRIHVYLEEQCGVCIDRTCS